MNHCHLKNLNNQVGIDKECDPPCTPYNSDGTISKTLTQYRWSYKLDLSVCSWPLALRSSPAKIVLGVHLIPILFEILDIEGGLELLHLRCDIAFVVLDEEPVLTDALEIPYFCVERGCGEGFARDGQLGTTLVVGVFEQLKLLLLWVCLLVQILVLVKTWRSSLAEFDVKKRRALCRFR